MEEEIYFGKYVFVSYLDEEGEAVYGGKLEKIVLKNDKYKIFFKK